MVSYIFQRYELKYLLSAEQYQNIISEIENRMKPDAFGQTTIQSLYYDTDDYRLIRSSIEKPNFKEKVRLRCYGLNDCDKDVFLEMKRKSMGIVYKRRISLKENEVDNLLEGKCPPSQIGLELQYFLTFYEKITPKVLILYDRNAYVDPNSDLRVTFDRNVRYRTANLDLNTSLEGCPMLSEDNVLMELKTGTAIPLWLCDLLSKNGVAKTSFSKYGTAYEREFLNNKNLIREHSNV